MLKLLILRLYEIDNNLCKVYLSLKIIVWVHSVEYFKFESGARLLRYEQSIWNVRDLGESKQACSSSDYCFGSGILV